MCAACPDEGYNGKKTTMWGRKPTTTQSAPAPTTAPAVAPTAAPTAAPGARTPALATTDDLLRHAGWERLSDSERAALISGYPTFAVPTAAPSSIDMVDSNAQATQDWVAALVAGSFQSRAAEIIRIWLDDAAPDSHLYLGGNVGMGRRSLVASLARQAMAKRPSPPDYVYIPVPSALDRAYLLTLPRGTGKGFATAIDQTLRTITSGWSGDDSSEGSNGNASSATPAAAADPISARIQLIASAFAPLQQPQFAPAQTYLGQLRAAFAALAATPPGDLPVSYNDMPTVLVPSLPPTVLPDAIPAGGPVIVGSLIRDKLDDLLMRANGGVLILPATDPLIVDGAWPSLITALTTGALTVKAGWPLLPLTLRVALIGDSGAYAALDNAPGDFERAFRYEAWCSAAADWTPQSEAAYAVFAQGVAQRHQTPAWDASGIARLVEEGARRGDGLNRTYLSTNLALLHDLAREAGRLAQTKGRTNTTGDDVEAVMWRRRWQQGLNAKRVREAIFSGQEITPTSGSAIGQINGLGVYSFHPPEGNFAIPTRISATVSPGSEERLLDIEHAAEQADADHVRGEMTVEGYLAYRYGQDRPVTLAARIRFEQEHGTTGGDSASGAMLFALLSALAQAPIRYSYAVTGAVGQYGEMQPIGDVNTKIEGFWELCRQRRAQGEQSAGGYGMLIPAVNTRDLMLRAEVAEAIIREGWFHIWPISTVDDALELLMGLPAAEVHTRVERRLQRFYELTLQSRATR